MRSAFQLLLAGVLGMGLGAWFVGGRVPLHAQDQAPIMSDTIVIHRPPRPVTSRQTGPQNRPPDPLVSSTPITEAAARTWLTLNSPLAVPFEADTPLDEVMEFFRKATVDDRLQPRGLPIYLDEVGMQQAQDVTPQNSVKLAVERIPLKSALTLMLRQLGLVYTVNEDGLVIITSPEALADHPNHLDSLAAIRGELLDLRKQVERLQRPAEGRPSGQFE